MEALDLTVDKSPEVASPESSHSCFNFAASCSEPSIAHRPFESPAENSDSNTSLDSALYADMPSVPLISMIRTPTHMFSQTPSSSRSVSYLCNMCNLVDESIYKITDHLLKEHSEIDDGSGLAIRKPSDHPIQMTAPNHITLNSAPLENPSTNDCQSNGRLNLRSLQCTSCCKNFFSPTALHRHLRLHRALTFCHCHICQRGFSDPEELRKHMTEAHQTTTKNFGGCARKPAMIEPISLITSIKQEADSSFSNANSQVSSSGQPINWSQQSPDSSMNFDQIQQLSNAPGSSDKRTLNAKVTILKADRVTYLMQSLQPRQATDGRVYFKCLQCNITMPNQSAMRFHLQDHDESLPNRCRVCGYEAKTKPQLKVHLMRHNGEKGFHCTTCNYSCVTHSDLNRHRKSRTHIFRETLHKAVKPDRHWSS